MSTVKKQVKVEEVSIVDQLIQEANLNDKKRTNLTEVEAIKLVVELYEDVTSKNAMLKLIRSKGYSISMSRLFKVYTDYSILKTKSEKK